MSQQDQTSKWQPVMLVLDRRLECACGALAIFVTGRIAESYNSLEEVDVWCQHCFQQAQEEGGETQDGRKTEQGNAS